LISKHLSANMMDVAYDLEAATLHKQAGNLHFAAKRYKEALGEYHAAINALEGQDPSAKNELVVTCLSNMAQCHLNAGDHSEAADAAAAAIQLKLDHIKSVFRFCEATARGASPSECAVVQCLRSLQLLTAVTTLNATDRKQLQERLVELSMYKVEKFGAVAGAEESRMLRPTISAAQVPRAFRDRFCFQHSHDGADSNLLILLHGLGDSHVNFMKFGSKLQLPQTALLTLGAPKEVPLVGGGMWHDAYDDEFNVISPSCLHTHRNIQAQVVVDSIVELLKGLMKLPGWSDCRLHLLGYGDGATIALYSAFACLTEHASLASALCIGGQQLKGLGLAERSTRAGIFSMVTFSNADTAGEPWSWLLAHMGSFNNFQHLHWDGECSLPRNPAQTRQVMEHFGKALMLRMTALEHDPSVIRIT
jgi:predicted esterase